VSDKIIGENLLRLRQKNAVIAVATAVGGTRYDEYF